MEYRGEGVYVENRRCMVYGVCSYMNRERVREVGRVWGESVEGV